MRHACQQALSQDSYLAAEELDILKLVRDENDGHSLRRELFQGVEELFLLWLADAGRRLIEDQDTGTAPEQPEDFELLALADCQCVDIRVR